MRYSCLTKWFDGLVCLFDLKQRENEVWNHTHTHMCMQTHTFLLTLLHQIELTVSSPDTSQSSNEEEPQGIPAGIVVENITKVYKRVRQNANRITISLVSIYSVDKISQS